MGARALRTHYFSGKTRGFATVCLFLEGGPWDCGQVSKHGESNPS